MEDQLMKIPFHGNNIYLLDHDEKPYVPVKPIVENLGLDWKVQHRKLMADRERWGMVIMTIPSDGGFQETCCISLELFPGFLFSIDARKVREDRQEKVRMYQKECNLALSAYWFTGQAINPRLGSASLQIAHAQLKDKYIAVLEQNRVLIEKKKRPPIPEEAKARALTFDKKLYSHTEVAKMTGMSKTSVSNLRNYGTTSGRPKKTSE